MGQIVNLWPTADGFRDHLDGMDGWNDSIRLYRPSPAIVDGEWATPNPEIVE